MRILTLLIAAGLIAAAQAPSPPPVNAAKEEPKTATLDPLQLENLELKMALQKRAEADIQTAYRDLIARTCAALGGKSADDCSPLPRQPGEPQRIRLNPPVVAKDGWREGPNSIKIELDKTAKAKEEAKK